MWKTVGLMCCATSLACSAQAAGGREDGAAQLAWLDKGGVETRTLVHTGAATAAQFDSQQKVPLGSLWKLFVYDYLVEHNMHEPPYVCQPGGDSQREEDKYCCEAGEQIDRDTALARSCAPYFDPVRLGIDNQHWQQHWQTHQVPAWILKRDALKPDTEVTVADLLGVLSSFPEQARRSARTALLSVGFEGYGRDAWPVLGTGIRYKTFSWHRRGANGSPYAFGGAAGWLVDGTPFWFGARGSSRTALREWAMPLVTSLPRSVPVRAADAGCVDVDFFERYPIKAVYQDGTGRAGEPGKPVTQGQLNGNYRVQFVNGNWIRFQSHGEMNANPGPGGQVLLSARLPINEYVARVVEREGNAREVEAARALAIVARSYLIQNGQFESGCWHIADSSRAQRVLPSMPAPEALAASWFSDQIVLGGSEVNFHATASGQHRLAWSEAVAFSRRGESYDAILKRYFPRATYSTLEGRAECERLDAAEQWLEHNRMQWQRRLGRVSGFEAPDAPLQVCRLNDGHPYSDQRRMRIYVRGWRSADERITLAHEYLHLALRFHPNGDDEAYVEKLARQLIDGVPVGG